MPKKLIAATLYSTSTYGCRQMIKGQEHAHQLPEPAISGTLYIDMMKRMNELEEKVRVLSNKPTVMPPEKEEMLSAALSQVNLLEQELSATNKVPDSLRFDLLPTMERRSVAHSWFEVLPHH